MKLELEPKISDRLEGYTLIIKMMHGNGEHYSNFEIHFNSLRENVKFQNATAKQIIEFLHWFIDIATYSDKIRILDISLTYAPFIYKAAIEAIENLGWDYDAIYDGFYAQPVSYFIEYSDGRGSIQTAKVINDE